jgi:hypothetical protein
VRAFGTNPPGPIVTVLTSPKSPPVSSFFPLSLRSTPPAFPSLTMTSLRPLKARSLPGPNSSEECVLAVGSDRYPGFLAGLHHDRKLPRRRGTQSCQALRLRGGRRCFFAGRTGEGGPATRITNGRPGTRRPGTCKTRRNRRLGTTFACTRCQRQWVFRRCVWRVSRDRRRRWSGPDRRFGVRAAVVAPQRECQRDHQQNRCEPAPRQRSRGFVGNGFETAHAFGGFAISVFASFDFDGNWRGVAGGQQIVGNRLIFIEAHKARIGADEALIEDASRQLAELIFFQSLQHAGADLGGDGNLLQRDLALFALQLQFFAKGWHWAPASCSTEKRNSTLLESWIIGYLDVPKPCPANRPQPSLSQPELPVQRGVGILAYPYIERLRFNAPISYIAGSRIAIRLYPS